MKVWTNDIDTVIAEDVADARAVLAANGAMDLDDIEWSLIPDDKPITIVDVDGEFARRGMTIEYGANNTVTKTAAEWIASEGRGSLCTTEY